MNDAPPDAGLLADALEALAAGRLPHPHALQEVVHLLESRPSVVAEMRRAKALRLSRALRDLAPDEYPTALSRARRVALEAGVALQTARGWLWMLEDEDISNT